ncbi:putative RNA-directed DNA polymerase from mobile element jockey-like [Apostichopus japonicus]|uniref:Putative RNA-directed DNA polymerase from mobile element jockey-like n=1 Tax=Stichopus japonicus TaxID=307972 RepID=A0A2G8JEJ4_STIJA|nr:putative RNA-directed DNA polymerase from mobile element jockey-like [Apostichopus japonicus]
MSKMLTCPFNYPNSKSRSQLVNLVPRYRPKIQREKPRTIAVKQWNNASIDHLRAELDSTDWDIFVEASADVHELTQTISDYISFCVENTIPSKQVKIFPNNKPWITKRVKVPHLWKQSRIAPVSKRPVISCMNDLRPIALMAVPMKACERLFLNHFKPLVTPFSDPLQFAYKASRSCEDAILVLLHGYILT